MKRRSVILGLGAAASAGAGVLGSGAISQITADRDVNLNIVQDSNAYLGLEPTTTTNIVTDSALDDGTLKIDLTEFNEIAIGSGFNQRSITELTDPGSGSDGLFAISNQSDRDVQITAVTVGEPGDLEDVRPIEPGEEISGAGNDSISVEFFDVTDDDRKAIDYDNPRTIGPAQDIAINVGIRVIVPGDVEIGEQDIVVLFQATEV